MTADGGAIDRKIDNSNLSLNCSALHNSIPAPVTTRIFLALRMLLTTSSNVEKFANLILGEKFPLFCVTVVVEELVLFLCREPFSPLMFSMIALGERPM